MAKIPFGAFRQISAVCCAHNLFAKANRFHTCSLRCILRQVRALTQNVYDFVFCLRKKFCEAFSTTWSPPAVSAGVFLF